MTPHGTSVLLALLLSPGDAAWSVSAWLASLLARPGALQRLPGAACYWPADKLALTGNRRVRTLPGG